MDRFLTVRQLQDRLQVDRITIYRMLSSGRLTGVKIGGQWRFREEDIQHLVVSQPSVSDTPAATQPTLPLPCLQAMQQLFSEAAEIAAVVIDPEGQPLTDFTNSGAFCDLVLGSEVGRHRCIKSWAALADGLTSAPRLHRCHAGLVYARTTIHVEGQALAAVIAGQALREGDPLEGPPGRLEELAAACALPLPRLQAAYKTIRRLDPGQQARTLHLLQILGVAACRIASERLRLVAQLDRIAEITMER